MKSTTSILKTLIGTALTGSALFGTVATHASCSTDPYLASICITAASFCPRGYSEADGRLLTISQNTALFSLLGTNYGGDGRTNFALPDLQSRTPVGIGRGAGLNTVRLGQQRGIEQFTLSVLQLPSHNHTATFTPGTGDGLQASTQDATTTTPSEQTYLGQVVADRSMSPSKIYTTDASHLTPIQGLDLSGTVSIGNNGGGQPFPTVPPQLGLRYCIAITGPFPPRD